MSAKSSVQIPIIPPTVNPADLIRTINDRLQKIQLMISQSGSASTGILSGTHGSRMQLQASDYPNVIYFETDRCYACYLSDGTQWRFADGIMYGPIANRPTGLTSSDEGFYYLTPSPSVLYRWTSGAWVAAIGGTPWNYQGIWNPMVSYGQDDLVSYNGVLWISAISPNMNVQPTLPPSSSPGWVMANWLHLASVSQFGGEEWSPTASYVADNVVSYQGDLWIAIGASLNFPPGSSPSAPWSPLDADNVIVAAEGVGYGVNLVWDGSAWLSGANPGNGCGALLVDATTGVLSLYAFEESPNANPPNNPIPQAITPTPFGNGQFLAADPRLGGTTPLVQHISKLWPVKRLQLIGASALASAVQLALFDLSLLASPSNYIYQLQDVSDGSGTMKFAGVPPWAGGTGQASPSGTVGANNWATGSLLVGSGADTTLLLPIGTTGTVLRVNAGTAAWEALSAVSAGSYGDSTHMLTVVFASDGSISSITPVATNGISATITTAKLTSGGTQGSMTFVNGILTAQTPAT